MNHLQKLTAAFLLTGAIAFATDATGATKPKKGAEKTTPTAAATRPEPAKPTAWAELPPMSRTVGYHSDQIVPIKAGLGFVTTIRLPETEEIVQVAGGIVDDWPTQWAINIITLKCASLDAHARTSMSVLCKSGHLYVFSVVKSESPDFLVNLKLEDPPAIEQPRFVSASELTVCEAHNDQLSAEVESLRKRGPSTPAAAETPSVGAPTATLLAPETVGKGDHLFHDYHFNQEQAKQLGITAVYHSGEFTYIDANPQELLAVYAYVDRKHEHLVEAEYDNVAHRYRITGVLNRGLLKIGKTKFQFERKS